MKRRNIDLSKFYGVFPAFYACYDEAGNVSVERTKQYARFLANHGANGVYLTGSSGECVFLNKEERKLIMRAVTEEIGDELTIIVQVGAENTKNSMELAAYAAELQVDAVSSIPPIYYPLSNKAVKEYWQAIIDASDLPFIIYNIPQNTGINVTTKMFQEMLNDSRVIGIKNTTMPVMDIQQYKTIGGDHCVVFNGPDEQFAAGRMMGADAGIGSTYSPMIELYLEMNRLINENDAAKAFEIQNFVTNTILEIYTCEGHIFSSLKTLMKYRGLDLGSARLPLPQNTQDDIKKLKKIHEKIMEATEHYVD